MATTSTPDRPRILTGVGSRETPEHVLGLMRMIAQVLLADGWLIRTGDARGADQAFREAIPNSPQITAYRPEDADGVEWAQATVNRYHPRPERLRSGGRRLMARNALQVLGPNGDAPSDLLICWTPNASGEGGTGQAIRIATDYGVRVHDLGDPVLLDRYQTRVAQRAAESAQKIRAEYSEPSVDG